MALFWPVRRGSSAGGGSGATFSFLSKRTDGFVTVAILPLAPNANVMPKATIAILGLSVLSRRTKG